MAQKNTPIFVNGGVERKSQQLKKAKALLTEFASQRLAGMWIVSMPVGHTFLPHMAQKEDDPRRNVVLR
jgi:hypothetical protein